MPNVKYNNHYKYIWNTQDSELRSLADENLSIDNCGKNVFILNCLLNKYIGLNDNDTFSLEYYTNIKHNSILACTLFDSYTDMYNKDHIKVITDVKEMFDRLEMYEMDTSGFYLDTGLVRIKEEKVKVKMLCVKQKYLNKMLQEAKDEDIEKAINLWDIYVYLRKKLIENFGVRIFLEGLGIYPSYLCIRKRTITGYAKQIKDMLKYYGLEYFLKTDDDIFNTYKIKDINATVTMMKLINN